MNLSEKYLPIGTVVLLKDAESRMMIIGHIATLESENVEYDYTGCLYPEGVFDTDKILFFNHDQIEKIYHLGLIDDEHDEYNTKLNELVNESNSAEQNNMANVENAHSSVDSQSQSYQVQQPVSTNLNENNFANANYNQNFGTDFSSPNNN